MPDVVNELYCAGVWHFMNAYIKGQGTIRTIGNFAYLTRDAITKNPKKLMTEFYSSFKTDRRKGTGVGIGKLHESQESDNRMSAYQVSSPVKASPPVAAQEIGFSQI